MAENCTDRMFNSISRDNNMNAVRYYLAICILMNHFGVLTGESIFHLPRIFGGAGSFFAISGFLMFSSFEKRPYARKFFIRRSRRIFPPYFLIVIVAAFGLSLLSSLPLRQYLTDPGLWKYLAANLCFVNFLHPDLPGVFTDGVNLTPVVNGALWTMKGEVLCYLSVPLVYRSFRNNRQRCSRLLIILVAGFAALYLATVQAGINYGVDLTVIQKQFRVFMLFFLGALINLKLDTFIRYRWHFIIINGVLLMSDYFGLMQLIPPFADFYYYALSPFVTGTMVIACCLTGHWGRPLARHDAVTYDIYLFHWPIIQVLVYFGIPASVGAYPSLLLSIAITSAAAFASWHFIGKPILNRGKAPKIVPAAE